MCGYVRLCAHFGESQTAKKPYKPYIKISVGPTLGTKKFGSMSHPGNPMYPIWVLGSDSHYSVIFAQDIQIAKRSNYDVVRNLVKEIFDEFAVDRESGIGTCLNLCLFFQKSGCLI